MTRQTEIYVAISSVPCDLYHVRNVFRTTRLKTWLQVLRFICKPNVWSVKVKVQFKNDLICVWRSFCWLLKFLICGLFLFISLQDASHWSVESRSWNLNAGKPCELDDYPCEEFHALATADLPGSVLLQQRLTLLEMLANNWDTG